MKHYLQFIDDNNNFKNNFLLNINFLIFFLYITIYIDRQGLVQDLIWGKSTIV